MARVRMFGTEFIADLIEDLGNGTWKAVARAHTGRTGLGTPIIVKQSEILEAAAAEMPKPLTAGTPLATGFKIVEDSPLEPIGSSSDNSVGLNDLETAMAKERETLPSPADLIAQHRESLKQAVSVPADPTQRPPGRQLQDVK